MRITNTIMFRAATPTIHHKRGKEITQITNPTDPCRQNPTKSSINLTSYGISKKKALQERWTFLTKSFKGLLQKKIVS